MIKNAIEEAMHEFKYFLAKGLKQCLSFYGRHVEVHPFYILSVELE